MRTPVNRSGIGMTSQRTRNRLVARLREQGINDERVLNELSLLPRHLFVDEALAHRAYEDTALPIGEGQTISQPYIVALMTQLLLQVPQRRTLEVGTGCGYQTALLAALCESVFTIERLPNLAARARKQFSNLELRNVRCKVGDGYQGWAAYGPYDGILVAAAPATVPEALLAQLAPGGRLVIPVGESRAQHLLAIDRTESGFVQSIHERVTFVPLVPDSGSRRSTELTP